jgi:Fic family protein
MIFSTPNLPPEYIQVIEKIQGLREQLRFGTSDSLNRWTGTVARMSLARAIHGSNTMEGINVTLDDAIAAVDREEPIKPQDENWYALVGYREAMDYIIQLAKEPHAYSFNDGTILGLHFMMMKYDLTKYPGRWRPAAIHVTNTATNQVVYEGPDAALVPGLISEFIDSLNTASDCHVIVKAAMAHLNLTMIHPFKDGNGRMARALQTMVLSRGGILYPVFSSIEEYVGRNTADYYNVLAEVGKGNWHPEYSALPWIRFCLIAHYRQAQTLLRRLQEMGALYNALDEQVKQLRLPSRSVHALIDAAMSLRVKNPTYRKRADISMQLAKKDLRVLVDKGLLISRGERRGRYYIASKILQDLRNTTRLERENLDPFVELEGGRVRQHEMFSATA